MLSISDVLLAGRGVITGPGVISAAVLVCQDVRLDICIRKQQHSVSGSEGAVVLQNAKRKRHLDTGKFGLDW